MRSTPPQKATSSSLEKRFPPKNFNSTYSGLFRNVSRRVIAGNLAEVLWKGEILRPLCPGYRSISFHKLPMNLGRVFAKQIEELHDRTNLARISDRWSEQPRQRLTNSLALTTFHELILIVTNLLPTLRYSNLRKKNSCTSQGTCKLFSWIPLGVRSKEVDIDVERDASPN
ncbi:hypothetical protein AAG570_011051 [Ranatra chinensis]|uniref:Uncharacterized protein n=1 Tax=Ranatra chinensis TaxID=642074 RepID=A0ABD0YLM6_9HEMI